jgi:hypothetical protein
LWLLRVTIPKFCQDIFCCVAVYDIIISTQNGVHSYAFPLFVFEILSLLLSVLSNHILVELLIDEVYGISLIVPWFATGLLLARQRSSTDSKPKNKKSHKKDY